MAEERLQEIRRERLTRRKKLIEKGSVPYPSEVRRTHTIGDILEKFNELSQEGQPITILGRIVSIRAHGALTFFDVQDQSGKLQCKIASDAVDTTVFSRLEMLDAGDWVQVSGELGVTPRGQQTLEGSEFHIVSKSIRPLPESHFGLKDQETRYRQREVDLLLNKDARNTFEVRASIIAWLRSYLTALSFLEVETPILQPLPGGAAAKPFETHHNALDMNLYLRIAPELYLKRLITGGFERVFEIGKNFRNEGISREHNPEFTMLEFYWTYADYEDLMDFTEEMLERLARELLGTTEIAQGDITLSFDRPFKRIRYTDLLHDRLGIDILAEKNPHAYTPIFEKEGLEIPRIQTYTKLVDELYKELIRPTLIQPTLVYDYPVEMVPLAKQNATNPKVAEMFQLLMNGTEIVKAYTELNDPVVQRERFEMQQANRDAGDEEAQAIDESYLRAMEYGMPPVAGYGLGIDRLVMVLTNAQSIRDTILFPLLKPEQ